MQDNIIGIPSTVFGSKEWIELEQREYAIGPDSLLDEIIEKKLWSNAEIIWVLKRMIFFYGKKDAALKKIPIDRLFTSMTDILRIFYLIVDITDPELDENMLAYICNKLTDSTWGINKRTRDYLHKMNE
jgi:hypothetical protein